MVALFRIVLAAAPFLLALFSMQESFILVEGTIDELLNPFGFNVDIVSGVEHPSTIQIIEREGYKAENHTVTTKDGYILEIHRIAGSNDENNSVNKSVVFVMPGIFSSSSAWVLTIPEKSLAFLLADAGYDVWIGNARGTTYGRKNVKLTVHDKKFWSFSFHEIGVHDVPAMIDYVLQKTNQKKLSYVGHSQGTTAFYVMSSERPEYQEKVDVMFSLAPVAFLSKAPNPLLQILARVAPEIKFLANAVDEYEVQPPPGFIKLILSIACNSGLVTDVVCLNTLFVVAGFSPEQANRTLLPVLFQHFPVGASLRQLTHFAQVLRSGKFRQYDYGAPENMKRYGKAEPPSYDLGSIKVPVRLHYATNDLIADPGDVHHLHQELGNSVELHVATDAFNHFDFLWGKDAKTLVYDKILKYKKK